MKRFIVSLVSALMLAVLLSACSGGGGSSSNNNNNAQLSGTVKVVGGSNQNQ